jgi:hypothetical protein
VGRPGKYILDHEEIRDEDVTDKMIYEALHNNVICLLSKNWFEMMLPIVESKVEFYEVSTQT